MVIFQTTPYERCSLATALNDWIPYVIKKNRSVHMLRADLKFCDKKAVDRYEHCCLVYRVFVERKDIS